MPAWRRSAGRENERFPVFPSRLLIPSLGLAIVAAAIAAYANSFHVPFAFDDGGTIVQNETIRNLASALHPPSEGMPVTGRPIANLSFAVNYAAGGLHVWGYHAANLLIHILAALALFGIVRRTLRLCPAFAPGGASAGGAPVSKVMDDASAAASAGTLAAFAIALLWALHPLQTESVTYLSQRVESLMGLFYLLTLYLFIRYIESDSNGILTGRSGRSGRKTLGPSDNSHPSEHLHSRTLPDLPVKKNNGTTAAVLSVIACLLGMATKEVMVTAPVVVLLYDRTFVSGSFRAAWRARRGYYLALAATWVVLAALLAGTGNRGGTAGFNAAISWPVYALTQFRAIAHYLRLVFWPAPLIFFYGSAIGAPPAQLAADIAVVLALAAATVWLVSRRSALGFAGACFFLILAPSSSVVPVATETIAEHRMYLPLAAVVAVVVCAIFIRLRRAALPLCLALAAACAFATASRNEDYRSSLALWRTNVEHFPSNEVAQYNLGIMLAQAGDTAGAVEHYRDAIRLKPDYVEAYNNLGRVLADSGHFDEAIADYGKARALDPTASIIPLNLGDAYLAQGRLEEAAASYQACIRLDPERPDAVDSLGVTLGREGDLASAMADFRRAIAIDPGFVEAHSNLGNALAQTGRTSQAAEEFGAAARLAPGDPEIRNDLGCALAQLGRNAEARVEFEAALRLKPGDPTVSANLARLPQ